MASWLLLIRDVRHQAFVLELGEPQVLRQAVVQLARETRALLERGSFGFGEAQAIERGIGAAAARACPSATRR